jgi:hypothetical protein
MTKVVAARLVVEVQKRQFEGLIAPEVITTFRSALFAPVTF